MVYLIPEYIWEQIVNILKQQKFIYIKSISSLRLFIEAVYFITKSGCQWRLLPPYYGLWNSVYKRFKNWQKKGVWKKIFDFSKKEPDLEQVIIDSTIIRSQSCASGYEKNGNKKNALGQSVGGFTTKIHVLCDGLGNPLKFILTEGKTHDITQGENLIKGITESKILADRGYDSEHFIQIIKKQRCVSLIPNRKNRKIKRNYDTHIYKERYLIEFFFGKIKYFRRIFSRFDKSSGSFMAFLNFVGAIIWLK